MCWFYVSWENPCYATLLFQGSVQGLSLSPTLLGHLSLVMFMSLPPPRANIPTVFYLQRLCLSSSTATAPSSKLTAFICLTHFLIVDFNQSGGFRAAHCWLKSSSSPLLPLFAMTIKGQNYASCGHTPPYLFHPFPPSSSSTTPTLAPSLVPFQS